MKKKIITPVIAAMIIAPPMISTTALADNATPTEVFSSASANNLLTLAPNSFIYAGYDLPDGTYGEQITEKWVESYNNINKGKENPSLPIDATKHETPSPRWVAVTGQEQLDKARTLIELTRANTKVGNELLKMKDNPQTLGNSDSKTLSTDALTQLEKLTSIVNKINNTLEKRTNKKDSTLAEWMHDVTPSSGEKEMQTAPFGLGGMTKSGQEGNDKTAEFLNITKDVSELNKLTNKSLSDVLALVTWRGDSSKEPTIKAINEGPVSGAVKMDVTLLADNGKITNAETKLIPSLNQRQENYINAINQGLSALN